MARKKRKTSIPTEELVVEQEIISQTVSPAKRSMLPIVLVSIVVLGVLLFLLKGQFVAATVNGQPISRMAVTKELEKQGGKKVLDSLIVKTLILEEGKKKNITVAQSDVDQQIKKIDDNFKKQGQNIDQLLQMQGMSRADLNDQIREQLVLEKLLSDKVKVTDKEIDQYLAQNKNAQASEVSLSPTPPPDRETVKQQLQQQKMQAAAQNLVDQLKKNAKISYFVSY